SATGGGLVDIVNGVGTKSISDQVAQTVNLSLSDSQSTGFNVSSVQDVIFADRKRVVYGILNPADGTVDAPVIVTVQLQDQFGNLVSSGQDKDKDVTLNTSGAATGGGVVDIVNGVGTKSISDQVAQTVNLSLSDSQSTGFNVSSVQDVIFAHGVASAYRITAAAIRPVDGASDGLTIRLVDQFGNTVTTFTGDKTLTFNGLGTAPDGQSPTVTDKTGSAVTLGTVTTISLTNGVNSAGGSLIAYKAEGPVAFTASDGSLSTSGTGGSGVSLTVTHDAAAEVVRLNPADGTVDAPITVTVQLQDQFGNVVSSGSDSGRDVTLNTSGSATGSGLVDIVNGIGTKSISDQLAETVNLSLTDTQGTTFDVSSVQDVIFAHGAATKLQILLPGETAAPGTLAGKSGTALAQTAGTPFTVTVNAVDATWNLVNTVTDTVRITSSDVNAILPFDAALVAGTQAFSVTLKTGGTRTVTASDITDPAKSANT